MRKDGVLITGAGGFIGSHVVRRLLKNERYRVVAFSRKRSGDTLSNDNLVWIQGSFLDAQWLDEVFSSQSIRAVIHLAALRGAGSGGEDEYLKVNVEGTERLLEASLKHHVDRFIFCSSVGVYGTIPAEVPATRATPFHGDNLYHRSKILAEEKVRHFLQRGLDAYIVRPTITYGAGDTGFPKTLVDLIRARRFLLSSGDVNIHLLNVSKFAELLQTMLLKECGGELREFVAADAEAVSLKELADLLHQHYYGAPYPSFLRMPGFAFAWLRAVFRLLGNEKWLTRIELISTSWHYDIHETIRHCSYRPAHTTETFLEEMQL